MALEDEIINIEDLDVVSEINLGDYVLLETANGTSLIDFKDFIIGVDNITFFDKISGTYLQSSDISSISAKTLYNESLLSSISGVNTDVDNLNTRINSVESSLVSFINSISSTGLTDDDITDNTNSKIGFTVTNTTPVNLSNSYGFVRFSEFGFKGTGLTEGAGGDIYLGAAPGGFFYKAKGSYGMLFNGNISIGALPGLAGTRILYIKKNNINIGTYNFVNSSINNVRGQVQGSFNFSIYVNLVAGDTITLAFGDRAVTLKESTFSGIRI